MKNNIDYYEHEVYSHEHWKFSALRKKYGWEGEGKFWTLNNMIGQAEGCVLDLSLKSKLFEIASKLDFEPEQFTEYLQFLVKKCQLLTQVDGEKVDDSLFTTKRVQDAFCKVDAKRSRQRKRQKRRRL